MLKIHEAIEGIIGGMKKYIAIIALQETKQLKYTNLGNERSNFFPIERKSIKKHRFLQMEKQLIR